MGILTIFLGLPSSLKKYLAYAGAFVAFVLAMIVAVNRHDRKVIAQANLKATVAKQRELHEIRTKQLKAAADRPSDDKLDRMFDDGDF